MQKQEIASMGLGMFVMHQALRLAPEYLWFLFISPEENRKKKKEQRPFLACLSLKNDSVLGTT